MVGFFIVAIVILCIVALRVMLDIRYENSIWRVICSIAIMVLVSAILLVIAAFLGLVWLLFW